MTGLQNIWLFNIMKQPLFIVLASTINQLKLNADNQPIIS